jgi:hypothetical protein
VLITVSEAWLYNFNISIRGNSRLSGGVLAIGHMVRRFRPRRGNGFLRAIKVRSGPSFEGKIKPPVPSICFQMTLLVGLPESSGGRIRCLPLST